MTVLAEPYLKQGASRSTLERSRPEGAWALFAYALIVAVFLGNFVYVSGECPLDLATDEAYYWDWSRRLDLSYYSKGPLVAYLIRGSCSVFGDTELGVRFP